MSLYKFTHIPLLKNDAQLKQKKVTRNQKEKEKKEVAVTLSPCASCIWTFLSFNHHISPPKFSFHFREKLFGCPWEKTPGPHHLFSFVPI